MKTPTKIRRAVVIYVAVIVAPALALLAIGLQSVERQYRAIQTLTESNRKLTQEKLAVELRRRLTKLADECLREQGNAPPFRKGKPVALHFFVVDGNAVKYPELRTPPPKLGEMPEEFRQAEQAELIDGRLELALDRYKRSMATASADNVRAQSLMRMARCEQKLGRTDAARLHWRMLIERFGRVTDPSHRPYELIARLELSDTAGLYEKIVNGDLELSGEQFDYYLTRLNRPAPPRNRYQLARQIEERFRHVGPLGIDEIYSFALPDYQLFYRMAGSRLIGFAVNDDWVNAQVVPRIRTDLGISSDETPSARRDLILYGGVTLSIVCLLGLGIFLLIRDVSRETQINRLRADFVSGVSHELKTPLTLIRLYAETLLHGRDFPDSERRGFYEIITRESERLTHLIEKVLRFSRIERGEKQYSLEKGSLTPVISQTIGAYRQYLEQSGFEVETRIASAVPDVDFDPDAVSQALVNLVDNAVKYSGDAKFIGVAVTADNGHVAVEVADQGIGIAPEHHEKIFDRFYRVPNGAGKGGYGLGLFLVRHIMTAHGGRVELVSERGRGSRFRLMFPVSE